MKTQAKKNKKKQNNVLAKLNTKQVKIIAIIAAVVLLVDIDYRLGAAHCPTAALDSCSGEVPAGAAVLERITVCTLL